MTTGGLNPIEPVRNGDSTSRYDSSTSAASTTARSDQISGPGSGTRPTDNTFNTGMCHR